MKNKLLALLAVILFLFAAAIVIPFLIVIGVISFVIGFSKLIYDFVLEELQENKK